MRRARTAVASLLSVLACCALAAPAAAGDSPDSTAEMRLRVWWGHTERREALRVEVVPSNVTIAAAHPLDLEPGDEIQGGVWRTESGAGDADGGELTIRFPQREVATIAKLHVLWKDLIQLSDHDTARRLTQDPAYRRDARRLTFELDGPPQRGFTVSVDQLQQSRTFWIPELGVYLDASAEPVPFARHLAAQKAREGLRVLHRAAADSEASYEEFKSLWEDMGSPHYRHSAQRAPGHVVCVSWDSAIPKFGIDRGAGAWNDYGNPDRFRLWFDFAEPASLPQAWRGQELTDGFPVLVTRFEKDGSGYEVEQFAYPLRGPPAERHGDIPMVLLARVTLHEWTGHGRSLPLLLVHQRKLPTDFRLEFQRAAGADFLVHQPAGETLLCLQGLDEPPAVVSVEKLKDGVQQAAIRFALSVPPGGGREFVVKLPSPLAGRDDRTALAALDYSKARQATLKFWGDFESRGARFRSPEPAVNELFRANLWHALRLPRRHGGQGPTARIDLPYSNFAYDQKGTPWPVNQAVYVDYMIYGLRGYFDVAAEELAVMFRENQETNGHVKGYANWLVYTPSLLYVVAQNYLLSQNRQDFENALPASLRAMQWCLDRLREAESQAGAAKGLVRGPLNDGTGDGIWAFNQAYLFAGLDLYGRALKRHGHPQADRCLAAAANLRRSIEQGFAAACVQAPLVPLRDGTWIPYVPCEVTQPVRLMEQWYPTDVDTGALHLLRLKALPPTGLLAESLLNDHEDNLFLHGWGMANEPVYNPQATAYLYRDEPKAAIRAFYSMMASAFSHTVFEPVEHRWTWGQYFGPPSTDGAWAELYRQMLIQERDDGCLLLFAATPRKWLEDGKQIDIENAPTYYGKLSARVLSRAASGTISTEVQVSGPDLPTALLVRLRHPRAQPLRGVRVNGKPWKDFDPRKEWVRIERPSSGRYTIEADYP